MAQQTEKDKSVKILEEVKKRQKNRTVVDIEEEQIKLVIFSLLDARYAFFSSHVKEILQLSKISFVPGSPRFIHGVINVRGDIESVVDLNTLFGLPRLPGSPQNRIIIAEANGIRSGILVGPVDDVKDIPKSSISGTISTLREGINEVVAGETRYNGENVIIITVEKLFNNHLRTA